LRPTTAEHLYGMKRILNDAVIPRVQDTYARTALQGVIAALDMLAQAGPKMAAFLTWDNIETERLISEFKQYVPAIQRDQISQILESRPSAADVESLDRRNSQLRTCLTELISALSPSGRSMVGPMLEHLRERSKRNPYEMQTILPGAAGRQ
jgi:hypothetical protein